MGAGFGNGIFIEGGTTAKPTIVTFGTGQTAGETTTISGDITDQTGSDPNSGDPGVGKVVIAGSGTVVLGGDNTYTGGTRSRAARC